MTHPHLEGLIREAFAALCVLQGALISNRDDPSANDGGYQSGYAVADGHTATRLTPIIETLQAALAALPGGGVDASPLMPTLAVLKETNPVVRACFDMYRHAQSRGYPFSLHSMLALLIAEMDRRHDRIEKLALDTLNMRPGPFFIPTPPPHEADRNG